MGKITRQGEASHVTTIVPEPGGDPEVIPQVLAETGPRGETEGQTGNENTAVEDRTAEPTREELETVGVDPDGEINDDHRNMVRDLRDQRREAELNPGADAAGNGTSTEGGDGPRGTFQATGEAEVTQGEQPPVDQSVDKVKEWVGDDYVKAGRALDAEKAGRNRTGLVQWLEKVAAQR